MRSESVVIAGFSARTISPATAGLIASMRQYMNPRSRRSGLSTSSVAHLRTLCTIALLVSDCDLWMKSFTAAVRSASWTCTTRLLGCKCGYETEHTPRPARP